MALIKCPECGNLVSDHATSCPKCGFPVDKMKKQSEQSAPQPSVPQEPVAPKQSIPQKPILNSSENNDSELQNLLEGIEHLYKSKKYAQAKELVASSRRKYPTNIRLAELATDIDSALHRKRNGRVFLIAIVILAILVGVGYSVSSHNKTAAEEQAWSAAKDSNTISALNNFMTEFPNGKHYDEALQLYMGLKGNDEGYWKGIETSQNASDFQNYLTKFPNGAYAALATNKIDSIDYDAATKKSTPEAFQAYLTAHPNGVYAQQAHEQANKIQSMAVSDEEKSTVKELFSNYYSAYQNQDEAGIKDFFNSTTHRYYTKTNATKDDIVAEMKKTFEGDVKSLDIEVESSSFKVTKDEKQNLKATFYVIVNVERADASKNSSVRSAITATVDQNNKITSITSRKISKE